MFDKEQYTVQELASLTGLTVRRIQQAMAEVRIMKNGKFRETMEPCLTVGRTRFYSRAAAIYTLTRLGRIKIDDYDN